jgi:hypothetical protein
MIMMVPLANDSIGFVGVTVQGGGKDSVVTLLKGLGFAEVLGMEFGSGFVALVASLGSLGPEFDVKLRRVQHGMVPYLRLGQSVARLARASLI